MLTLLSVSAQSDRYQRHSSCVRQDPRRVTNTVPKKALRRGAHDARSCRLDAGYFGVPFLFPPASGKTHMETTMNAAMKRTKFPNSGRIGEPLQ
jgi:hypothetical protein